MSGHTKGPWVATRATNKFRISFEVKAVRGPILAKLIIPEIDPRITREEAQANALLMAAAPLLLEALREVEWEPPWDCCPRCEHDKPTHAPACTLAAALKAAEVSRE